MDDNTQKNSLNVAAIDIGSNSAKMIIKSIEKRGKGFKTKKLQFLSYPVRLGIDVFTLGKISEQREERLIRTMKVFRQLMKLYKVQDYRACATSALRDAKNGKKILKHIKKDLDINIEIISGDEEAMILRDFNQSLTGNLLFMDVGGGSTELSLVCDGQLIESRSFNIGTLRILSNTITQAEWDKMRSNVIDFCHEFKNIQIIGSGGNINKLYRLTPKDERFSESISVKSLRKLNDELSALSVEERMEKYDLKEYRADTIVPAAQLFLMVAEASRAEYITVPNVGLVDGIINMMAEDIFNTKFK